MSVKSRVRLAAAVTVALVLLAGCGGGETASVGQSGEPQTTTSEATTEAATTTTVDENSGGIGSASDQSPDGVYLTDGTAPDQHVINLKSAGFFIPSTLTIKVGDKVTFAGDGSGSFQLRVGSVQPVLVSQGVVETYRFEKAGEIVARHEISGDTATITVEGDGGATTTTAADRVSGPDRSPSKSTSGTAIPNSQVESSSSVPGGSSVPASP